MRILVVSDTHSDVHSFLHLLRSNSSAEVVIHCGDGADDVQEVSHLFPSKMFINVRGNCDFCTDAPASQLITLEGKKIFITHGHLYNVKNDLLPLALSAREQGADLVIFGHTHVQTQIYDDGLYMLNPGSLKGYKGEYALVDITEKGILINCLAKNR